MDVDQYRLEIITGQYRTADEAQKAQVRRLLGENAEYDFEIYFHWYNIVHEIGHAVMQFYSPLRPHPADEEQLVNDFAAAYWAHYGESGKMRTLREIVSGTLSRFAQPADGMSYLEYAKKVWGKPELYTFNNYGWFQFHCVSRSLSGQKTLAQALSSMGVSAAQAQEKRVFVYPVDEAMPVKVLEDAARELRRWGIPLPQDSCVVLSGDPNCHMCNTVKKEQ